MNDEIILTLNSPITEEQWDAINDVDFDHTDRIWFHTKHGKDVEFVKDSSALHESCTDCPLYDHDRHRCPRFNKVIPTAIMDAQPEIIRCRDCKHWDKTWRNDWSPDYHYCSMIDEVRKGDFYCADAERRTDSDG